MQQRDAVIRLQAVQLVVEPRRDALGVTDESFHLRLAEGAAAGAGEAAAEAFRAGDAERHAVDLKGRAFAFEHHRAGALHLVAHAVGVITMVIMITKHDDDRNLYDADLFGKHARLIALAMRRQVAANQQHVRRLVHMAPVVAQPPARIRREMNVGNRRDSNHQCPPRDRGCRFR